MNAAAPASIQRWEGARREGAPHFQRGEARGRVRRAQRRVGLRPKHIAAAVLGMSLVMFGLSRVYLFAIGWRGFAVKKIVLDCRIDAARADLEAALAGCRLGNIFLLDIGSLRAALERHRWVGEAVIRRDFPSTLRVEVRERRPAAVVDTADGPRLVSREGVILGPPEAAAGQELPLLRDGGGFRSGCEAKLALAWACLEALGPAERGRVESLDLSEFGNVVCVFRRSPTRLILGGDRFAEKIALFREAEAWLTSRFGELAYLDLRLFQDRLTVKPAAPAPEAPPAQVIPTSAKEAD
jgi:hypothetical protein